MATKVWNTFSTARFYSRFYGRSHHNTPGNSVWRGGGIGTSIWFIFSIYGLLYVYIFWIMQRCYHRWVSFKCKILNFVYVFCNLFLFLFYLATTAIMALMVHPYATLSPDYAVMVCFLAGCIILILGLLNLGVLVRFISIPVITGKKESYLLKCY